jgi:hypothetical protein
MIFNSEPKSFDKTLQDKELGKWELVMKNEIDSLIRNQT